MPQTEWLKQDIYFLSTLEAASLIKVSATVFFETFLRGLQTAADCPMVFVHAAGVSAYSDFLSLFTFYFKNYLCI